MSRRSVHAVTDLLGNARALLARGLVAASLAAGLVPAGLAAPQDAQAVLKRWKDSPHGPTLERLLPPVVEPRSLPEPLGEGATLLARYCVQCHHLPSPAMHHAAKWAPTVERMVARMQGRGNLGKAMADLMAGVEAPTAAEQRTLVGYLERHALVALDPARVPEAGQPSGEAFRLACGQCHVLPDPRRYRAQEWPAVVTRMQEHMASINRVVGSRPVPGEPQLRVDDINAFLARHARDAVRARGR